MARTEYYTDLHRFYNVKNNKKYGVDGVRLRAFLLEVILVLNYGAVGGDDKRPGQ